MPRTKQSSNVRAKLQRWSLVATLTALAIWLTFFDSHSILKRVRWHQDHKALTQENAHLQARIEALEKQLDAGISDAMVERIAREQYGMHRPGETVYRIQQPE